MKQHSGCEGRRMNPALGQQRASADAGWENPTGQQPCNSFLRVASIHAVKYSHQKITMTLTQIIYIHTSICHFFTEIYLLYIGKQTSMGKHVTPWANFTSANPAAFLAFTTNP